MKFFINSGMLLAALAVTPLVAFADDRLPANSKSLLEIVTTLEKAGYGPIVDASFDDGNWEVEVYRKDTAFELLVNPSTGEVVSEHRDDAEAKPPAGAKLLSEIIKNLVDAGYADVNDVSFEGRTWEVEARRDDVKRELRVNPETAEVISDRADD
ncbi:MAG: PepSY domain-containing protein [Pirellulales bacterium]